MSMLLIKMKEEGNSTLFGIGIGSCHVATVLREDVRNHIRRAHEECVSQYLRFQRMFDDDMSVVIGDMISGQSMISFYNVDCIFDFYWI